jgi:proline iminopeptidase
MIAGLTMQILYPNIKPYATHHVAVGDQHTLYVEESGSVDGIPVVVVHGGPGAGSHPDQRRFFDPQKYRIILFDQRGCGQSTPQGELENNTTQKLIADMEKIRETLAIEKWVVFGGSWGAALSLLYAQAHPQHVQYLMVRSVLLARENDLNWFFKHGANQVFPLQWRDFVKLIPRAERQDILGAYNKLLNAPNELTRMAAAKAWSAWNRQCATFNPPSPNQMHTASLRLARIESHYFTNRCFIEENQILNNLLKMREVSGTIIHGHYDMICPLNNAVELHEGWGKSTLEIIHTAGHASSEPALTDAIIRATQTYAKAGKIRS